LRSSWPCPPAKSIRLLFGGQSIPETDKQNSRSAAEVALQRALGEVVARVPYLNIAFQIAARANPHAAITCPAYAAALARDRGAPCGEDACRALVSVEMPVA
jgi:hypothetical protein